MRIDRKVHVKEILIFHKKIVVLIETLSNNNGVSAIVFTQKDCTKQILEA